MAVSEAGCDISPAGYDVKLCDVKRFERHKCPLCNLLLRDPIQTERGEVACEQCYSRAYVKGVCPIDKEPSNGKVNRDKAKEKDVLSLTCCCKFESSGCKWTNEVRYIEEHEKECSFRSEKCEFCQNTMLVSEMVPHQSQCSKLISRGCPYTGCTYKSVDGEKLKKHLHENIIFHSHLQVKAHMAAQEQITSLEETLKTLLMEREVNEHEIAVLRNKLIAMKVTTQQALTKQGQQEERISMLENQMKNLARENESECRRTTSGQSADIGILSTNVSLLNKQISDLDLRQQMFENTTFDGKLVWKIDKVVARMQQAVSAHTTALHSGPVFTHRHGYKFCARLYLNGDGLGRGTHVSLFFVIMKSEYDSLLVWPFNHSVKFKLINQQRQGLDVIESFNPDQQSTSFMKPVKDMNVASGCPRFISIDSFKNGGFVRNDSVFLEIDVGKVNLSST